MQKTERHSMQMHPVRRSICMPAAINRIAHDRMTKTSQVGAQLVRATGDRSQPQTAAARMHCG